MVKLKTARKEASLISRIPFHHVPICIIFVLLSAYHYHHISSLFENDRFFSHLSTLEREMTFRTEAGFYYSYYKTIISAPSLLQGLDLLVNDTGTEYPAHINTLQRFNVYPELLLGTMYRTFTQLSARLGYTFKQCYGINRGQGQEPTRSCVGAGDETIFYVNSIFVLGGVQLGIMYLLGVHLSGNVVGGLLTASSFLFNHGECTRVMWTPPLRENFSFPFLILQTLCLSRSLKERCAGKVDTRVYVSLALSTLCFVLPWQFSQFVLLTQTLSLLGGYLLGFLTHQHVTPVIDSVFIGYVVGTVLQFLNPMLISSLYVAAYISFKSVLFLNSKHKLNHPQIRFCRNVLVFVGIFTSYKLLSSHLLSLTDDAHIFNILRSKFSDFKDFHTLLYVCSKEFDFIELETFYKCVMTLLLPLVGAVVLRLCAKFSVSLLHSSETTTDYTDNYLVYHILQFACYLVMAVILMRLKLFMTPYMCVLAALAASDTVLPQSTRSRYILGFIVLAAMSIRGYQNIDKQWNIMGEYNNPDQEQLFSWVEENTPEGAVFAGSMPLMANLRLSTNRNIVNHPHYEDSGLRTRTKAVYKLFSRKGGDEVHETLRSLHVQYAVVDIHWCANTRFKSGCSIPEIWDVEDTANVNKPTFCSKIRQYSHLFKVVYFNKTYKILKLL